MKLLPALLLIPQPHGSLGKRGNNGYLMKEARRNIIHLSQFLPHRIPLFGGSFFLSFSDFTMHMQLWLSFHLHMNCNHSQISNLSQKNKISLGSARFSFIHCQTLSTEQNFLFSIASSRQLLHSPPKSSNKSSSASLAKASLQMYSPPYPIPLSVRALC